MKVILVFVIGFILGSFLLKKAKIFKISSIATDWSLYLLLLVLGITIGANDKIVCNFFSIGLKSFLFAIASILGSIVFILPLYLIFKKKVNHETKS